MKKLIYIFLFITSFSHAQIINSYSYSEPEIPPSLKESQTTANQIGAVFRYPDRMYCATQFIASSDYTITQIEVNLTKIASPTMDITCYLYSDNSGVPGSLLATSGTTLAASSITDAAYHPFSFDGSYTVNNTTTYWVVLRASSINGTNYVSWNSASFGGNLKNSSDGTTWSEIIAWHGSYKITGV